MTTRYRVELVVEDMDRSVANIVVNELHAVAIGAIGDGPLSGGRFTLEAETYESEDKS